MAATLGYDAVLKDVFQSDRPRLLDNMTGGLAVRESLNVEFTIGRERRADLVLRLEDWSIFHLEFQSENDRDMGYREGIYGLLIAKEYRAIVRQAVLYFGRARMNMPSRVNTGGIQVEYELIDIRQFRAEDLMQSSNPGDLALALLGTGGKAHLREILERAKKLKSPERERVLAQMAVLSGLRRLSGEFTMELKNMGMTVDIQKNVFLREIREVALAEGKAEGKAEGRSAMLTQILEAKFGALPTWARSRLEKATSTQLDAWAQTFPKANTLEDILGPRVSRRRG